MQSGKDSSPLFTITGCALIKDIWLNISNFTLTFQISKFISMDLYEISGQPLDDSTSQGTSTSCVAQTAFFRTVHINLVVMARSVIITCMVAIQQILAELDRLGISNYYE